MSPRRRTAEPEKGRARSVMGFIKLCFGDDFGLDFRSLHSRTQELTTDEAQTVIRLINYGEFDVAKISEAISQFKGRIAAYEFGREGSPILYVRLPYWTHQRESSPPRCGRPRLYCNRAVPDQADLTQLRDDSATRYARCFR
jgi:hypothetical protein